MTEFVTVIVAFKAIALVLGALITYFAARAYQRTGSPALRALAIGFGIVTIGAISAGVIDLFLALDRDQALVVESFFSMVGFAVIFYSLYAE